MNKDNKIEPIIILGAGRSGTKFLRSLLEVSKDVTTIPYDVGYIWRYGNEFLKHDELKPEMANKKVVKYIRANLPKLIRQSKPGAHYLIEKSVPNTLRPAFLYKVYPEAKFVHLIRDGRAVTESSIRLWSEPVERSYLLDKLRYFPWTNYKYALWYLWNMIKWRLFKGRGGYIWGPRYKGIEKDIHKLPLEVVCARQWKKSVEISQEQLAMIPKQQVIEIRYEKLVADASELRRLCEFIGISDTDVVVENFRRTVKESNAEKWRKELRGEYLERVNEEIGELISKLGY